MLIMLPAGNASPPCSTYTMRKRVILQYWRKTPARIATHDVSSGPKTGISGAHK